MQLSLPFFGVDTADVRPGLPRRGKRTFGDVDLASDRATRMDPKVRPMLQAGQLKASLVGGRWTVKDSAVEERIVAP